MDKMPLDFNTLGDKEIVEGLLRLPMARLMTITTALDESGKNAVSKGQSIAKVISEDVVQKIFKEITGNILEDDDDYSEYCDCENCNRKRGEK